MVPGTVGTPAASAFRLEVILSPIACDRIGRRPNPDQPGADHLPSELRILGEEPVTGMDGVGFGRPRHLKDSGGIEIRLGRRRRTDVPGLVGDLDMQRVPVEFRIDSDRPQSHLLSRPDDADRNLAPVGDEQSSS